MTTDELDPKQNVTFLIIILIKTLHTTLLFAKLIISYALKTNCHIISRASLH